MDRYLRVNPIACDGHGICADLFPERVVLDDWGYPIIDLTPIPNELLPAARRAVANCPVLALRLEAAQPTVPGGSSFRLGAGGRRPA